MADPSKSPRVPLIAGNWKMHKNLEESRSLMEGIAAALSPERGYDIGIFPAAVNLAAVADVARSSANCRPSDLLGAQNMHFEEQGAFTGETSAAMVLGAGGNAVLLGHSERRHVFGEDDEMIGKKVVKALASGLVPVLCVGETLDERDADRTVEVVSTQLRAGLSGVDSAESLLRVVIAYEPVWAIGTGRTATPDQAQEVHAAIRSDLATEFSRVGGGKEGPGAIRILYGGSVKPDNAADLLARPDIDGALVGGASLQVDSFLGICAGCPTAG